MKMKAEAAETARIENRQMKRSRRCVRPHSNEGLPVVKTLAVVLVLMFGGGAQTKAGTLYVDGSVVTPGDGSSWEEAFKTLRQAVENAMEGDTVVVGPGEYTEDQWLVVGEGVALTSRAPSDPGTVEHTVIRETLIDGVSCLSGFTIWGGCLGLRQTAVAIVNNIIRGGEGLCARESSPLIAGNVILHNSGTRGGGIHCRDSSPSIINNVIAGNSAEQYGGGIYCSGSSPYIANNTIVGNSAGLHGGGIYADETSFPATTNCIIWDNGDDLFGCSATYSCISDGDPGQGNIALYPHFVDRDGGDYRLLPWSPCIDAGDPLSDFSLEPEPNGGRVNMGAYGNTPQAATIGLGPGFDDLPDDWEMLHFGHLDYGGMEDADGDGILNIDEYRFGWDPTVWSSAPIRNITAGRSYDLIQAAIAMASPGDEIAVQPGRYVKNVDFLGNALTLRSVDPSDPAVVATTILDAGGSGSVVSFIRGEGRDSILSGFTITGGMAKRGAGVFSFGSSPTICDNVIIANSAPDVPDAAGWGVYCYGGSPLLMRNTIDGNDKWEDGGAVYVESGSPTITDNIIRNSRGGSGGGICVWECASATIDRNVITGNRGGWAGGIYLDAVRAYVANNLIAGNQAIGICYRQRERTTIINNTIVGNSAADYGAGIRRDHGGDAGTTTIANCILWGNGDELFLYGRTIEHSCIEDDDPGEGNIHVDPGFVDPENGDYRLRPDSPCINAGDTAAALDVAISPVDHGALISWSAGEDADGNPRISGRAVDIGAYEYQDGPPDVDFFVEYSSDLKSWEAVDVGPAWEWLDDTSDGLGSRFYTIGIQ